jgi:hypothetical protein
MTTLLEPPSVSDEETKSLMALTGGDDVTTNIFFVRQLSYSVFLFQVFGIFQ